LITTDTITDWLREPDQFQGVVPQALQKLTEEYPYFLPGHYLKHIALQQDGQSLYTLQQAFPANRVVVQQLLEPAKEQLEVLMVAEVIEETDILVELGIPQQQIVVGDYFSQQGIEVSSELPEAEDLGPVEEEEKSLLVMMSFEEWLSFINNSSKKAKEEAAEQKALKTMWQKQKLAAAIEEESDEIPESVFEMAVNSISRNDDWASESMAEVYARQGKVQKAIDIYEKLSLLNPEKNTYFAAKIENLQKDLEI
jgi:tetratricopeptide (TPR) repeat protein